PGAQTERRGGAGPVGGLLGGKDPTGRLSIPGRSRGRDHGAWSKIKLPAPWLWHSNVRGDAGSPVASHTREALPEAPANRPVPPLMVSVSSPRECGSFHEAEKAMNSWSPFAATTVAVPLTVIRFVAVSMTTLAMTPCPVKRPRRLPSPVMVRPPEPSDLTSA